MRSIALIYGILCHSAFVLGVGLMALSLWFGMSWNVLGLSGVSALCWNAFLILQFPLLHSFLLSSRGSSYLRMLAPKELSKDLITTLFALVASVQLILVFGTWAGSGIIYWQPSQPGLWVLFGILFLLSWLILLKAMYDAGLGIQMGYLGWLAIWKGEEVRYSSFARDGLYRYTRNPIYVAFALTLWTAPVWSLDRLILTALWSMYCVVGPLLKEQRYRMRYGDSYKAYEKTVPYWIPRSPPKSTPV